MPTIVKGSPVVRPAVPAEAHSRAARPPGSMSLAQIRASLERAYQLPAFRPHAGANVLRALGGVLKSGPALIGVGLAAAAVDLLAPRPANQSEVGWLTRFRAKQFVDLSRGLGVAPALSRLSAGLFVSDISVAKFQAERTGLAKAIARQDSTAALRHFRTIAKAMAFDPSATNAGAAAVDREIARLKNVTAPRLPVPARPGASGKAQGASNLPHDAQAARAQRSLAPKTSLNGLPALGGSRAAASPQSARLERASRVTHTGGSGTRTEVETRFVEQRKQALDDALRIVYERRKTGGSLEHIARQVYDALGLQRLGVSKEAFVARASRLGNFPEAQGAGRVSASAGGGLGSVSGIRVTLTNSTAHERVIPKIKAVVDRNPDNLGGESFTQLTNPTEAIPTTVFPMYFGEGDRPATQAAHFHNGPRRLSIFAGEAGAAVSVWQPNENAVVKINFPANTTHIIEFDPGTLHSFSGGPFAAVSTHLDDLRWANSDGSTEFMHGQTTLRQFPVNAQQYEISADDALIGRAKGVSAMYRNAWPENAPSPENPKLKTYINSRVQERVDEILAKNPRANLDIGRETEIVRRLLDPQIMAEPIWELDKKPDLANKIRTELAKKIRTELEKPETATIAQHLSVLDVMRAYKNYKALTRQEAIRAADSLVPGFMRREEGEKDQGEEASRVRAAIEYVVGGGLSPIDRGLVEIFAPQYGSAATVKQILVDLVNELFLESGFEGEFDPESWVEGWLNRPNLVLGGRPPRDFIGTLPRDFKDTAEGTNLLLNLIGGMAAGSYF